MLAYVKSELLKQKHSFNIVLLWLAPLLTILLALVLMNGNHLQSGSYNWWYMLLLPGCFTMFSAFMTTQEQRKNRHGLLGIAVQKRSLWIAQIVACTLFLLITCLFFFAFITISGMLFGQTISVLESLFASILLFCTFVWQLPLWMYLAQKTGALLVIILSLFCNFIIPVICAEESYWWIPFAIPARLMCVCIRVLPNGLSVEAASVLNAKGVILPGIIISAALFVLLSKLTANRFEQCEV